MLGVNVTFVCKPGKRADFLEGAKTTGVHEEIRQEKGCIQYDFFLPQDSENEVLLVEKWVKAEDQKIHLTQPHMEKFTQLKTLYVDETKLEFYELPDKNN